MADLPPLDALRVFESAARHLSFNKAAEDLHITPSAVSHRMRTLEDVLGVKLFRRLNRRVELTADGQSYLAPVGLALDQIRAATRSISADRRGGPLTMSLAPAFAIRWLLPRLVRFQAAHPDIEVRFVSSMELTDFSANDVDLAVRFGRGGWPGLDITKLIPADDILVCSPEMLRGGAPLNVPQDVANFTRLHVDSRSDTWRMWLLAAGVEGVDPDDGPKFQNLPVAIEAAINGLGLLIADAPFVTRDLDSGRLISPFDIEVHLEGAYYLVYPEGRGSDPRIKAFEDWVMAEIAASEEGEIRAPAASPVR